MTGYQVSHSISLNKLILKTLDSLSEQSTLEPETDIKEFETPILPIV
jgi:hypothetical protein